MLRFALLRIAPQGNRMRKLSCRFERVTLQQEKAFVAYVAELLSVNLKLGFSHAIALHSSVRSSLRDKPYDNATLWFCVSLAMGLRCPLGRCAAPHASLLCCDSRYARVPSGRDASLLRAGQRRKHQTTNDVDRVLEVMKSTLSRD